MSEFTIALGMVAPYYNLVLTLIAFYLFIKLFRTKPKTKTYFAPWGCILLAMLVFVLEEILTILRAQGIINIPIHINGFFELAIIILFIYTLLIQRQYVKKYF